MAEKARTWKRRIEPAVGDLKINDVTEEDAGKVVRKPLRLDESGRVIGGKAEAGNIYRLLHHMFNKAVFGTFGRKNSAILSRTLLSPKCRVARDC